MNHDKAMSLVLNAIDVPADDRKTRNDVMGVPVKAYPHLAEKLAGMGELQSHASEITGWINSKRETPTTIQQVIDFISRLDIPDNPQPAAKPQPQPQPQVPAQPMPQAPDQNQMGGM
jgi:hypothetical protein